MKNSLFIILFLVLISITKNSVAQDTLLLKNGTKIASNVLEVGSTEIKYKKADNPDGPTFVTKSHEVFSIRYKNGACDTIKASAPAGKEKVVMSDPSDLNPPIYRAGPFYKQGYTRMKEKEMQRIIGKVNDSEINLHIRKAKVAKGMGYIGFIAIPAFIGGLVYTGVALINNNDSYYGATNPQMSYGPSIGLGILAAGTLTTSIVFKSLRKKHNNAALNIYNEKY
jgi:hypothetical protein